MYTLTRSGSEHPIKLIELSIAAADDRAGQDVDQFAQRSPKAEYWYRALRFRDEREPDPSRFAACAFPATYEHGTLSTYVISDGNTLFKKDLGHGRGLEFFPTDDELRGGWKRLD